ncbi:MAG: hypothetical protein KME21_30405 [Desmonostoc vinosum HA7617-LM4]|jgi:hypothetical protein|nr:hypothetical protein [Desmonostoc vinosum HA7617-LM4]
MTSKLITPESPLLVPPLLASEIGLEEAVILQQIHYYCQISKHIKADGRRWFWKTLNDWGQTLPFLKISAIRRAIANLKDNFKLIDVCRHSEKTWYQANWFTVNVENVQALWNRICQNQQIDVSNLDISICSLPADQIKEFTNKEFASQQHAAVELKKDDQVEETKISEPDLVTHFVNESELDYSSNDTGPHEDISDAADSHVQKTSDAIVSQPGLVVSTKRDWRTRRVSEPALQYVEESQQDDLASEIDTNEGQFDAPGGKPSKGEIAEICTELRRLRINPQPCLGVVKKHWANVTGAIARVKEAVQEGWCENPTGLFINSCKSGAKGKNAVSSDVSAWFSWARRERIVLAMSGVVVYTADGKAVELQEMMRRYPMQEWGSVSVQNPEMVE